MNKQYNKTGSTGMVFNTLIILLTGCLITGCQRATLQDNKGSHYYQELIQRNEEKSFDADIVLSKEEELVNQELSKLKKDFINYSADNQLSIYKQPFHKLQATIETSSLFDFLSKMPKGGLLHTHSGGITDARWIIKEAQKLDNCYVFTKTDHPKYIYGQLAVFKKDDVSQGFVLLGDKLKQNSSFADELFELLVLKRNAFSEPLDYWIEFEKRFKRIGLLITYRPFFKVYYKKGFLDLIANNVQHLEIRFILEHLFDANVESYPVQTMVEDLNDIVAEINKDAPLFTLNLIYTSFKFFDIPAIKIQLNQAFSLKNKFPHLVTGFDLVADEATGHSIAYFNECWAYSDSLGLVYGFELPLYLHAGESCSTHNKNLFSIPSLNNKRIGHGLNLVLFPELMETIKQKNILVEINPISNQILGYVDDLRNHPARILLNNGVQCSISSDDPGAFGYSGLSYDFWVAVINWDLDLKAIKKLVYNSISYASMDATSKTEALQILDNTWNAFIDDMDQTISN